MPGELTLEGAQFAGAAMIPKPTYPRWHDALAIVLACSLLAGAGYVLFQHCVR